MNETLKSILCHFGCWLANSWSTKHESSAMVTNHWPSTFILTNHGLSPDSFPIPQGGLARWFLNTGTNEGTGANFEVWSYCWHQSKLIKSSLRCKSFMGRMPLQAGCLYLRLFGFQHGIWRTPGCLINPLMHSRIINRIIIINIFYRVIINHSHYSVG